MSIDNLSLSTSSTPAECTNITLTITLDDYPEETSWTLKNSGGSTITSGGTYNSQPDGSTIVENFCLPDGCYEFTINDTEGDGICCTYGNGSYSLMNGTENLASGGSFTSTETTNFCLSGGLKVSSFTSQAFMNVNSKEFSVKDFVIYPNPAYNILKIKGGLLDENTVVRIYGINGIKHHEINGTLAIKGIDIAKLKAGMYIIEVQNKKQTIQKNFIKK